LWVNPDPAEYWGAQWSHHRKVINTIPKIVRYALVPYRLNSAQFAQDIFVIACNCLKFSLLRHENKNSSPERFLAPAPLA
jgi:hypothetical protein